MRMITGDLWGLYSEVKVVPTNGMYSYVSPLVHRAHMGAGVAKQAANRWTLLPLQLGDRLARSGNRVYVFQVPPSYRQVLGCLTLATFPTKHDWRDPSLESLVSRSARELGVAQEQNGWREVYLPKVGCGLGGMSWDDVEPLLDRYLNDHFTVVEQG